MKISQSDIEQLDPDRVLSAYGTYGKQQMINVAITNVVFIFYCAQMMIMAFIGAESPFTCVHDDWYHESSNVSFTFDNQCTVVIDGNGTESDCGANGSYFVFHEEHQQTFSSEFGLICGEKYQLQLGTSIMMIGSMIGATFIGQLSDKMGRKRTFNVSCWINAVISILASFSPNHTVFLILRFFVGMSTAGYSKVAWVLCCESVALEFRNFVPFVMTITWFIGYCAVGFLCMYVNTWRIVYFAISVPMLLTVVFHWYLSESLHWLMAKNRYDDVRVWLERCSEMNGKEIDVAKCGYEVPPTTEHSTGRTIMDVFRSKVLTFYMFIFCVNSVFGSFIYWGLSILSTKLSSDRYTGYFLSGIVELPVIVLGTWLLKNYGRRTLTSAAWVISGLPLVVILFVPLSAPNYIIVTLTLIGRAASVIVWCAITLLITETFPTTVRNVAYGFEDFVGKLGAVIGPFAGVLNTIRPNLATGVFGLLSMVAGILCLTLPETKDHELPMDIDDVDPGPLFSRFTTKNSVRNRKPIQHQQTENPKLLNGEKSTVV